MADLTRIHTINFSVVPTHALHVLGDYGTASLPPVLVDLYHEPH